MKVKPTTTRILTLVLWLALLTLPSCYNSTVPSSSVAQSSESDSSISVPVESSSQNKNESDNDSSVPVESSSTQENEISISSRLENREAIESYFQTETRKRYDYIPLTNASFTIPITETRKSDTFLNFSVTEAYYAEHYFENELIFTSYYAAFSGEVELKGTFVMNMTNIPYFEVDKHSLDMCPIYAVELPESLIEEHRSASFTFDLKSVEPVLRELDLWQETDSFEIPCTIIIDELAIQSFYQSGASDSIHIISINNQPINN